MTPVYVALIVALGAAFSAWWNTRSRRKDKEQDWARQDAVAAQAAKAAELLLVANERVAQTAEVTNGKLDVIHTLVNSNMTAAMQAQLVALQGQLVLMNRVATLKGEAGTKPNENEVAAIVAVEAQIAELGAALKDRLAATETAAAAAAAAVTTTTTTTTGRG
jgi:hypothetical protein